MDAPNRLTVAHNAQDERALNSQQPQQSKKPDEEASRQSIHQSDSRRDEEEWEQQQQQQQQRQQRRQRQGQKLSRSNRSKCSCLFAPACGNFLASVQLTISRSSFSSFRRRRLSFSSSVRPPPSSNTFPRWRSSSIQPAHAQARRPRRSGSSAGMGALARSD